MAHPREDALTFVPFERVSECRLSFRRAVCCLEGLGEVAERVSLHLQAVGSLYDLHGLACKRFRLRVLSAVGVDACQHLPPESLRCHVLG